MRSAAKLARTDVGFVAMLLMLPAGHKDSRLNGKHCATLALLLYSRSIIPSPASSFELLSLLKPPGRSAPQCSSPVVVGVSDLPELSWRPRRPGRCNRGEFWREYSKAVNREKLRAYRRGVIYACFPDTYWTTINLDIYMRQVLAVFPEIEPRHCVG